MAKIGQTHTVRTVRNRRDLLSLINEMGLSGTGVELGVAEGDYSELILQTTNLKLFSVDRWSDAAHNEAEFKQTSERLAKYSDRNIILRMPFDEALTQFDDGSLDFVYVDGYAHTGQEDGKTMTDWWPKMRQGGVFGGHDYDSRWKATIKSVNVFVSRYGLQLYTTASNIKDKYRSWFVVKP